jgi:phosphoglycolate phosphatase-like HAD superfamily hydrolase
MTGNSSLFSYKYYLFDLDNTIIDETQYLFAAYDKIANDFSLSKEEFIHIFLNEGRENLFNKIISRNNLPEECLSDFLNILRTIILSKQINIYPKILKLLNDLLSLNKSIIVVTNGNAIQQKNKIQQTDWQGLETEINFVLADLVFPKPSKSLFKYLKEEFQLEEKFTLMIGDSATDEEFAKNSNIAFQNVGLLL